MRRVKRVSGIVMGAALATLVALPAQTSAPSVLTSPRVGTDQSGRPLIGTNYTHYRILSCKLDRGGLLAGYHQAAVRSQARRQLGRMQDRGVEAIRLIVWHQSDARGLRWGIVSSNGGRLSRRHAQSLRRLVGDIRAAGIGHLTITLGPQGRNDPRSSAFSEALLEENWSFLVDVRRIVAAAGPADIRVDLLNEGAPSPFLEASALARVKRYLATMYSRYVSTFGNQDVTVSTILKNGTRDDVGRLENLISSLQAGQTRMPRFFDVHITYTGVEALHDLETADRVLDNHRLKQPLTIGETVYNDAGVAEAIATFVASSDRAVDQVLMWPQIRNRPCPHISVAPPYDPSAYVHAFAGLPEP